MDVQSELNLYGHVNFLAETLKASNQIKNNRNESVQNKTALNVRPKRKKKTKSKQKQSSKPQQQQLCQKLKPNQQQRQNYQKNSGAKKNFKKTQFNVSSAFFVILKLLCTEFIDFFFPIPVATPKTKYAKFIAEPKSASVQTQCQ